MNDEPNADAFSEHHQLHVRTTFQYIDKLLSEAEHTMVDAGSPPPLMPIACVAGWNKALTRFATPLARSPTCTARTLDLRQIRRACPTNQLCKTIFRLLREWDAQHFSRETPADGDFSVECTN